MTTSQMIATTAFYFAVFVTVVYFTRAKWLRIVGAAAGGAAFGVVGVLAVALGETQRWWRVPRSGAPHFELLLWLGLAVSCAPVYLITWRVARRFGGRGLAVCVAIAAIIGPPRDYAIAAIFPEWMVFSSGIIPTIADATVYALLIVVGHCVMRTVAGSSGRDSFARRSAGAES
jgi:hypothetical protein